MSEMIVKNVDLFGDSIIAAQDKDGTVWAGARWFCQGLGFSKGQIDRQIKNIQKDSALSKGASNLTLPTNGGKQEVLCIKLDFIPLWLAKISITDKTRKERPEFADKLLEYQLKAKDILAEAFMPQRNDFPRTTQQQIQLLAQGNVELNKRVDEVQEKTDLLTERFDKFEKELPLLPEEADRLKDAVNRRVVSLLGGKESNAYKNRSIVNTIFADAYKNLKRNFNVRKYNSIKREQIGIALRIAEEYVPPVYLADRIQMENAQQKFM